MQQPLNPLSAGMTRGEGKVSERCPCCGYLTLDSHASYDICQVCFWEDDGQGDEDADEVFGGPNGLLSLSQARRNYCEFGAVEQQFIANVRPPTKDEITERPIHATSRFRRG